MIEVTGYSITLPEAPSMNHYWRNWQGRTVMSVEGRGYKILVAGLCAQYRRERRLPEPQSSTVWWWGFIWHAGRRSGDLDNRRKVLQDALKGLFWVDDKQIIGDAGRLAYDPTNPRMEVTVQLLEVPHPFALPPKRSRARSVAR